MDKKTLLQAIGKLAAGLVLVCLLLFIPAGTIGYWYGWLFIAILFIPMLIAGVVLLLRAPELLKKRLSAREEQTEQKAVLVLCGVMFLAAFIVAGLNYRFDWLVLPKWAALAAALLFLGGYAMYAEVLRENAWLSRTVEVQENQKVIDTGLYGVVRHPMYAATLLMFLSMGFVLGAPISFLITLLYVPIIALRIKNEEEVLTAGLPGYAAYKEKVRYKVIPYVW